MHPISPIGVIHSPFCTIEDMPIQPKGVANLEGFLEIDEVYADGLKDLDGFSHIYLIYSFHQVSRTALHVTPFMDTVERGVFATRSPLRPNHIGISIVRVLRVEGNKIYIKGVDVLNETPLLDVKPYIEQFDSVEESRSGWMKATKTEVELKRSDDRFG
jgi:tRNA-Thr(GGU) m(6)t(6)A37 methyltransferase TsaA